MKNIVAATVIFMLPMSLQANDAVLKKQVADLKAELKKQNDRISRLEKLLASPGNAVGSSQAPGSLAWQDMNNWNRVKPGMSRSQVESILGKPTRVEVNSIDYATLFYQGEKAGSGYVSGNVQISDEDRVTYSGINPPVM